MSVNPFETLTTEDLMELGVKYKDNVSLATLVKGVLESRLKELKFKEVSDKFSATLDKAFNSKESSLIPPDGIYNVMMRYAEIEEDGVVGMVDNPEGLKDKKGNIKQVPAYGKIKVRKWVIEPNQPTTTHKVTAGAATVTITPSKANKRAIQVFKRVGDKLESVGKFGSGNKACEHLKLVTGGDSATRVLTREGYITEAYIGIDLTA